MNFTLWRDVRGFWAVCDGPGPLGVVGYIFGEDGKWRIEKDEQNRPFLDYLSAASALLGKKLPEGVHFFELKRGKEIAFVATNDETAKRLQAEGWTTAAVLRSN